MTARRVVVLAASWLALVASPARAGAATPACPSRAPSADARRFLDDARARVARFRDPEVARAEGYRPVGPDTPGMGRHWVHVGLIAADTLEAGRPPLLVYASLNGRPTLVGAVYARPLAQGDDAPSLPAPAACWHLHADAIDEEALAPHSESLGGHAHHAAGATRDGGVAMVHVWLWSENPAGQFAAQNWALPWQRLGLVPPEAPSANAAHALGAADDGGAYVEWALAHALDREPGADATFSALRPVLASQVDALRAHVARLRTASTGRAGSPADDAALAAAWRALWDAVERAAPASASHAVADVRRRMTG